MREVIFIIIFAYSNFGLFAQPSTALNYTDTGFDVKSYELQLDLTSYPQNFCFGINHILVEKTEPLDFYFHLKDLTVDSVFYNGNKIDYQYVNSDQAYYKLYMSSDYTTDSILIYYHGNMTFEDNQHQWGGVTRSSNQIFSMGVGFQADYVSCARHFMPCYDHPSDPAKFTAEFKVPNEIVVASNGLLVENQDGENFDFYKWKQAIEAPTYTLSFAAGKFNIYEFGNDIPIIIYGSRFLENAINYVFPRVENMLNTYQEKFYDYPYEKAGYVLTSKGSMEHSSCIHIASDVVSRYYSNKDENFYTVAHELAHQWFGNDISIADFREAWLSEGFAVFCEAIWKESYSGTDGFIKKIEEDANLYLNSVVPLEGDLTLFDFDRNPPSSNYPATIYYKGSVVLYMLMQYVGEDNFFLGFEEYYQIASQGPVTTELFKQSIEKASGVNLDQFFDQWVYGKGYPIIDIEFELCKEYSGEGLCIQTIKFEQIQENSGQYFTNVPFIIDFVLNDRTIETREFTFSDKVTEIEIIEDLIINSIESFNSGKYFRSLVEVNDIHFPVNSVNSMVSSEIKINPNPSFDILNIEVNDYIFDEIEIYSSTGYLHYSENSASIFGNYKLDIKSLPTGSYILKLSNKKNIIIKKFIKQR